MKLTCPKCRKVLPQIGNDALYPGDTVTCGLCLYVWTPLPEKLTIMRKPPRFADEARWRGIQFGIVAVT